MVGEKALKQGNKVGRQDRTELSLSVLAVRSLLSTTLDSRIFIKKLE
jgi:hypothetical protein